MDLIVIIIVNRLCKFSATYLRKLLAATFGAIWSVIAVMIPSNMKIIVNICTYMIISLVMIIICAGLKDARNIVKGFLMLYVVTFLLSGVMHFVYYNTYAGYLIKQIIVRDSSLFLFILISILLLGLLYNRLEGLNTYVGKSCRVCCFIGGEKINMYGLVDTGNVLIDPYYSKPICIAQKSYFNNILNTINDCTKVKYHIVPFNSLGCKEGLLEVITVDTLYIYYRRKVITINNALIGLTSDQLSTDNEFSFLVNTQLI